jgi:photosystem II stability/assembly factor-like uncharacterized protein
MALQLVCYDHSLSQWVDKSPSGYANGTYEALCLVSSGKILWAVGWNGAAMRSVDGGANWENVTTGVSNYLHSVFFTDSLHGWIVGGRRGWSATSTTDSGIVLATTDGGATWMNCHTSDDNYLDVWFLDEDIGWVVGSDSSDQTNIGVILHTTDGGSHWERSTINGTICCIEFTSPDRGFFGRAGYGDGLGGVLQRTTDGGQSWSSYSFGNVNGQSGVILAMAWENQLHGMCMNAGRVYYSSDAGDSWNAVLNVGGRNLPPTLASASRQTWFVTSSHEVLRTTNSGGAWDTVFVDPNIYDIVDIKFADAQRGVILTGTGTVITTANGGSTWTARKPTLEALRSIDVVTPALVFVGTAGGRIFKSSTGAETWEVISLPTYADVLQVDFVTEQTGWVSTTDGFYRTTSGGTTWEKLMSEALNPILVQDPSSIYAGTIVTIPQGHSQSYREAMVKRSIDGGVNWTSYQYTRFPVCVPTSISFWNSQHGLVGIATEQFFPPNWTAVILSTENGGLSWNVLSNPSYAGIFSMSFVNDLTGWALFSGGGGYTDWSKSYSKTYFSKTTDGGLSWVPKKYVDFMVASLCFVDSLHGYACGSGGVIYRTADGGEHWDSLKTDRGKDLFVIKFADLSVGYAIGANGTVLKTTTGGVLSVADRSLDIPSQFTLAQNYPNPFNPGTTIGFRVWGLGSSVVKLSVYDILGREVAALVNEPKVPGEYTVRFDGTRFASGVYYYRLTAGGHVATEKMLLIR